jgi:hypothetical protein
MSVSNGQLANQTTFNNAFVSRTTDSDTVGKVDLENAAVESGPDVVNVQREVNSLNSYTGRPSGSDFDETPAWTSNNTGSATDNLFDRAEALDGEFHTTTGHDHDGVNSKAIDAGELDAFNSFFGAYSGPTNLTAVSGGSTVVTTEFSGETAGGGVSTEGVVTTAPLNKVTVLDENGEFLEDGSGNRIYGRLTESAGVWTLTYYVNISGTETAHSFGVATDINFYWKKVYNQENRPTFGADFGDFFTADMTSEVLDASDTQRGLVSTGAQTYAGIKTFNATPLLKTALDIEDPGAGTNKVTIQAPTLAGSYTLTLPVDDGTTDQVLKTNGSGVLSWTTPSSGSGGMVKVRVHDAFSTSLPSTGVPITIDGILLVNNDRVLFSELSGGAEIYTATVSGGNVTAWNLQSLFEGGSSSPVDQDFVAIQEGDYYADNLLAYNGTEFYNFLDNKIEYTLTDNTSNFSMIEVDTSEFNFFKMEYSLTRGATTIAAGDFWACSNGTTADFNDLRTVVVGDVGVTFDANMSGANMEIRYTTTSTGTAATLKRTVKIW